MAHKHNPRRERLIEKGKESFKKSLPSNYKMLQMPAISVEENQLTRLLMIE